MKLLAATIVQETSDASGTVRVVLRALKRRPDGVPRIWSTHVETLTSVGPARTRGRYYGSAEAAWADYRARCERLGIAPPEVPA